MEKNVKLVDLFMSYDNMENKRILEERLRKAACVGDTDVVQELLNLGVDVNTRHSVNGWYFIFIIYYIKFLNVFKYKLHMLTFVFQIANI